MEDDLGDATAGTVSAGPGLGAFKLASRYPEAQRSDATWPAKVKVPRRCARCFVPRVDESLSLHSPGEHSDKRREGLLEGLRRDIDRARDDDRAGFLRGHVRVRSWPRFFHVLAVPLSSSATPLTSRSVRRTSTTRKSTPARSDGSSISALSSATDMCPGPEPEPGPAAAVVEADDMLLLVRRRPWSEGAPL